MLLMLAALPGLAAASSQSEAKQAVKAEELILEQARIHSLPSSLLKAVVKTESNFNRWAVSPKGAKGLMQLMPGVCEQYGVVDPFDSEQNLKAGTTYLKALMSQYRNLTLALAAYNAGPEAVDKHGGVPPYAETKAFIDSVYRYYNQFRRQIDPHAPQFFPGKPSPDQKGRVTVVIR
jgi:soluble lytic murein transglycosylase-like protein